MGSDSKVLRDLFVSFFRISPVTFGGGYAMLPLIEREVIVRRKWMDEESLKETLALCESVPGAVGINAAILVGFRVAGLPGALVSLAGVTLPAFLIVLAMVALFFRIRNQPWLDGAMTGIRAAVVALIVCAAVRAGKRALTSKAAWGLAGAAFFALAVLGISPFFVLLSGLATGLVYSLAGIRRSAGRNPERSRSGGDGRGARKSA
ncbi:chromate transporter [Staphylospora marina]|uniref:chromate transporter n=1 Tax=Staphylospora marina TaxID=2490858 RepID=UPI000F5B8C53|nr:chromate transporter [Staphylospora marina]